MTPRAELISDFNLLSSRELVLGSDINERKLMNVHGKRDWCFKIQRGENIPSGYRGELGVKGESGECRTSCGGGFPDATAAERRGERGGGGALRGGRAYACILNE